MISKTIFFKIHFKINSFTPSGRPPRLKYRPYAGEGKVVLTTEVKLRLPLWFEVEDFVNVLHLAEMENENPNSLPRR